MTDKKRSDIISISASPLMNQFRSGLLHGARYSTERIRKRPLIAIANSHTELTTGHAHLGTLARRVKEGILAAGGEAAEFNVPAPCVGHVCPEASDGGVIGLVEDGDIIEIDIPNRSIRLDVSDEQLAQRRTNWQPLEKAVPEGHMRRYRKHVRPACEGAILD